MKYLKRTGLLIMLLIVLVSMAGCGKSQEKATTVNMGYFNNITHAQSAARITYSSFS